MMASERLCDVGFKNKLTNKKDKPNKGRNDKMENKHWMINDCSITKMECLHAYAKALSL
jgi:hypothetical protein